jgi:ribonuclease P protein component
VVRRGRRAGRPRLVVHALTSGAGQARRTGVADMASETKSRGDATLSELSGPTRADQSTARVGFVVSKAVGNSVVRHRVTRRLRHLMADRIGTLPTGCALVVRALPASAGASSSELGADLDGALRRLNQYLCGDVV